MSIASQMEQKLTQALEPVHLEIANESHMHSGPATESHFKVTIVSERFTGLPLIKQHRLVNDVLKEELAGRIHALALHTYTPDEWFERAGPVPESPACEGGGKH